MWNKEQYRVYCGHVSLALSSNKERFEWQEWSESLSWRNTKLRASWGIHLHSDTGSRGEDTPGGGKHHEEFIWDSENKSEHKSTDADKCGERKERRKREARLRMSPMEQGVLDSTGQKKWRFNVLCGSGNEHPLNMPMQNWKTTLAAAADRYAVMCPTEYKKYSDSKTSVEQEKDKTLHHKKKKNNLFYKLFLVGVSCRDSPGRYVGQKRNCILQLAHMHADMLTGLLRQGSKACLPSLLEGPWISGQVCVLTLSPRFPRQRQQERTCV